MSERIKDALPLNMAVPAKDEERVVEVTEENRFRSGEKPAPHLMAAWKAQ